MKIALFVAAIVGLLAASALAQPEVAWVAPCTPEPTGPWRDWLELFGGVVTICALLANVVKPTSKVGAAVHWLAMNGRGIQSAVRERAPKK
jgi:hypothetical protein